jgi:hypothetical protein
MLGISYSCETDVNGNSLGNTDANGNPTYDCETFGSLMNAIKGLTNFAVVNIALPFSVVVLVWDGVKYMMSGGNPGKISEANKMFVKVLWGIFWVLGAWLVINLIMTTLAGGLPSWAQFLGNS